MTSFRTPDGVIVPTEEVVRQNGTCDLGPCMGCRANEAVREQARRTHQAVKT